MRESSRTYAGPSFSLIAGLTCGILASTVVLRGRLRVRATGPDELARRRQDRDHDCRKGGCRGVCCRGARGCPPEARHGGQGRAREKMIGAEQLANESRADAELAYARTETAKAVAVNKEMKRRRGRLDRGNAARRRSTMNTSLKPFLSRPGPWRRGSCLPPAGGLRQCAGHPAGRSRGPHQAECPAVRSNPGQPGTSALKDAEVAVRAAEQPVTEKDASTGRVPGLHGGSQGRNRQGQGLNAICGGPAREAGRRPGSGTAGRPHPRG